MKKTALTVLALVATAFAFEVSAQNVSQKEKGTVYMVSNAHLDTQWNWTVQQTIQEYIPNTLRQNFALFEQYPDYIFNFEGAVKYAWMKEYYPDMYEKLKQYIAAGRWHISGASWDANDPNMPSVESSIRNILLGQEFYQKEFGVLSTDIMLPDCFGFGNTLPSVAAHCGLIGFGTQKLKWRENAFFPNGAKFPFYFGIWEGIDGSRVMATLDGGSYSYSPKEPIDHDEATIARYADSPINAAYRYFGTGDIGGSVTPAGMRFIDQAQHNPDASYNIKLATSDQMFKDYLWDERLPVYQGELLMDVHATGCYTSKVEMKNLNRRNEWLLGSVEAISTLADRLGALEYPASAIDESWKRVLWHQFHDDLTGTSIPDAYKFSYNDEYLVQRQMGAALETAMHRVAALMDTRTKGTPVLVYNPISSISNDYVAMETVLPAGTRSVEVTGPNGRPVRSQTIKHTDGTSTVLFAATEQPYGLGVYDLRPSTKADAKASALKVSYSGIENRIYKISLDSHGNIASIWDKRFNRELVSSAKPFCLEYFSPDVSERWPSWEIRKDVIDSTPEIITGEVRITVEEMGSMRAVLKIQHKYKGSVFVQRIILTDGAQDERIDIVNTVDWQGENALVKASFPVSFKAREAVYDLGMAHIARGNNTNTQYEVFGHQWADITSDDGSYGVTILNDSRYGWDKPDDRTLRLTLLHTPGVSRFHTYQSTQDKGEHTFTYSIIGHSGKLRAEDADFSADCLNQKKVSLIVDSHSGQLGRSYCMLSGSDPSLRVKAFKRAQDGDGFIVRLYEIGGRGASGKVVFDSRIVSAEEVNGIEQKIGEASFSGNALNVKAGRFALKTYRVRLEKPSAEAHKPHYQTLPLPYDLVAYTTDAFVTQGRMDRSNRSFAGELLPEELVYRGVPFVFGEPNFKDAVLCNGQTIEMPQNARKLYILAASNSDDDVDAEFKVAGKSAVRRVESWRGFYGYYGWEPFYKSFLKGGDVAYIGTHTHKSGPVNEPYEFNYMYLIELPAGKNVTLPEGKKVVVFAATAAYEDVH